MSIQKKPAYERGKEGRENGTEREAKKAGEAMVMLLCTRYASAVVGYKIILPRSGPVRMTPGEGTWTTFGQVDRGVSAVMAEWGGRRGSQLHQGPEREGLARGSWQSHWGLQDRPRFWCRWNARVPLRRLGPFEMEGRIEGGRGRWMRPGSSVCSCHVPGCLAWFGPPAGATRGQSCGRSGLSSDVLRE